MPRLAESAAQWGVMARYVDAWGVRRTVDREALALLVEAVSAGRTPESERVLPPLAVIRHGEPANLEPQRRLRPAPRWRLEAKGELIAEGVLGGRVNLPPDLPVGSYALRLDGVPEASTTVLVAEPQAYRPAIFRSEARAWALAVQLYGVRSRRNWGHGDFTDLARLLLLARDLGAAAVGLNPLHALFFGRSDHISPYAPSSRLLLNPLYIDVEAVPDFPGLAPAGLVEEVAALRTTEMVDYRRVTAAKFKALRWAHESFRERGSVARRDAFEAYRRAQGSVLGAFAAFEVLRARFPSPWWEWPAEWRQPSLPALAALRRAEPAETEFHEYVQWMADQQLASCRAAAERFGLPIGLYLDVAAGVAPAGADAWAWPEWFLRGVSMGAPPDAYNANGQNWGLCAFNPQALTNCDFAPFRQMLRASMHHAGAVRLDHVLGLNRTFLVPAGLPAHRGGYVRFPFEGMLAVVAQESNRARCLVIGEDLGTVPAGLPATLRQWGVWSYRVVLFERESDGSFRSPADYPDDAVVAFNTHDLPTFAGWLSGRDLEIKRALDLDPGETSEERSHARVALTESLRRTGIGGAREPTFLDCVRFMARSRSRLLVVSLEDALGVVEQPNLPGTVDEHPNWQRKTPVAVEDLAVHPDLCALADALAAEGRSAGRRG